MSEPTPHPADRGERAPRTAAAEGKTGGAAGADRTRHSSGGHASGGHSPGDSPSGDSPSRDSPSRGHSPGGSSGGHSLSGSDRRKRSASRAPSRPSTSNATQSKPSATYSAADPADTADTADTGATADTADTASGATPSAPVSRPGGRFSMARRSLLATVLGVPPVAAVGVAAGLTAIGVAVDLLRTGTLGTIFLVCYLTGCALAAAWVRRSDLFWPMVAPPLLMASAVPAVVLLAGSPRPGAGVAGRLLVIGAPLVNGFPMMAWTTGLVLALGVFRLVTQRVEPRRRERDEARGAGRRSASPRRS